MLPTYYRCSSCQQKFEFEFREAWYCLDAAPIDSPVSDASLLEIPVRPAWCKACECITIVEDIPPLRAYEDAYAAARAGRAIAFPILSEFGDPESIRALEMYVRWRMGRRSAPRALCCGGSNYQLMDVATPLIKHAECEFGFIEGMIQISSGVRRAPGIHSPFNMRLYNSEGELAGLLTWRTPDRQHWQVEPFAYPPVATD